MKERIKELAFKANKDLDGNVPIGFAEKFAELLEKEFEAKYFSAGYIQGRSDGTIETVKECLQKCEQIRDDAYTQKKSEYLTDSGRLIYEGVFGGATNCGFAIQQHFGVEL